MIITIMPAVHLARIIFSASHASNVQLVLSFANEVISTRVSFLELLGDCGPHTTKFAE
jgi:hypothetical protein